MSLKISPSYEDDTPLRVLPHWGGYVMAPDEEIAAAHRIIIILYFRPSCYSRVLPHFHLFHSTTTGVPLFPPAALRAMGSPFSPAQSVRVVTSLRYLLPVLILLVRRI